MTPDWVSVVGGCRAGSDPFDLTDTPPVVAVEEIVPVRGERCAGTRCSDSLGDSRSDFLNVFRMRTDDAVEMSVLFDADDPDVARAELDGFARGADDSARLLTRSRHRRQHAVAGAGDRSRWTDG